MPTELREWQPKDTHPGWIMTEQHDPTDYDGTLTVTSVINPGGIEVTGMAAVTQWTVVRGHNQTKNLIVIPALDALLTPTQILRVQFTLGEDDIFTGDFSFLNNPTLEASCEAAIAAAQA